MGLGGRESTGTPIDMSSFYLLNEVFLFSELRCHLETNVTGSDRDDCMISE